MIMTSDPTRVGLKPTELILIPVQELTSDPTRVGLKLSGEITDWNRSVSSDPTRVGLKPGRARRSRRTRTLRASDPTRVGLKPCLKWRFQPLYQGVIG